MLIHVSCDNSKITNIQENPHLKNPVVEQKTAESLNTRNPEAVQEVLDGIRTEANAAWWGFNETDATVILQAAINSGAKKVIVPNMGKEWIVRPMRLMSNQEIVFEEGVIVKAKRWDFKTTGSCLFRAKDLSNITLRGYGATLEMWKEDYENPAKYSDSGWRHTLLINNCTNISVIGLKLRSSGGDGICVGGAQLLTPPYNYYYSEDIYIKDVISENHHRQGISVISAKNLIVEDCVFQDTAGSGQPSAGVDFEPDQGDHRLINCVFRNCSFINNAGPGILMVLGNLSSEEDISLRFEGCYVTSLWSHGIMLLGLRDMGPGGAIEFENCRIEETLGYGIAISDKSYKRARVSFTNCTWKNVSKNVTPSACLWISHTWRDAIRTAGGMDFIDCYVEDNQERPFLLVTSRYGIYDITGHITVNNPYGASIRLGNNIRYITLEYEEGELPLIVR